MWKILLKIRRAYEKRRRRRRPPEWNGLQMRKFSYYDRDIKIYLLLLPVAARRVLSPIWVSFAFRSALSLYWNTFIFIRFHKYFVFRCGGALSLGMPVPSWPHELVNRKRNSRSAWQVGKRPRGLDVWRKKGNVEIAENIDGRTRAHVGKFVGCWRRRKTRWLYGKQSTLFTAD